MSAPKGWTDNEKLGLILQIVSRAGPIPWAELTLPEGRTVKACQVMVDKEKAKVKNARKANGEEEGEDMSVKKGSPKKRKAAETTERDGEKTKKQRKGKNAAAAVEDDEEDKNVDVPEVKPKTKAKKVTAKKGTAKKVVKAEEDDDEVAKEEITAEDGEEVGEDDLEG